MDLSFKWSQEAQIYSSNVGIGAVLSQEQRTINAFLVKN